MGYTDLDVWKESRRLVKITYDLTTTFPKDEVYGLTNQMRRRGISIPSNIAKGCGRRTSVDTIKFSHITRGSLYELETQIFLALDQSYVSDSEFQLIIEQIKNCKRLLNGFIKYGSLK
ncbi:MULTISPECIES: four helix bundle protein [Flavobacteriaceae]|uniref:four helix bundle protein n=1 Tax=Flavobacteriaceae TaxID=49546 RepID=UPI0014917586|nr:MULTISPECIES: four helix bundle protein [Allomuricauda]MDC6365805.1 four helix bundle protein [Muricauda sp. AC10]